MVGELRTAAGRPVTVAPAGSTWAAAESSREKRPFPVSSSTQPPDGASKDKGVGCECKLSGGRSASPVSESLLWNFATITPHWGHSAYSRVCAAPQAGHCHATCLDLARSSLSRSNSFSCKRLASTSFLNNFSRPFAETWYFCIRSEEVIPDLMSITACFAFIVLFGSVDIVDSLDLSCGTIHWLWPQDTIE